jgi:glycosyltransferase involved in cell wall biosynthesis
MRLDPKVVDPYVHITRQVGTIARYADEFDIVHSHIDYFTLPITPLIETPIVTTLHGRLDLPDLPAIYTEYPDALLISISNHQRLPLANVQWLATVHNGIELEDFTLRPRQGNYLAFLGRIAPEKGLEWAIEVAKQTGMKLLIAAKVDKVDRQYYEESIKPILNQPFVEYIGEVDQKEKDGFLGNAYAVLFPIDWPEPFGLVMIEAMATGTPVIARPRGSVPEVLLDGKTGFVRDSIEAMVKAVYDCERLNRLDCREHVERFFSAQAMADGYEKAYALALESSKRPCGAPIQVERWSSGALGGTAWDLRVYEEHSEAS